MKILMISHTCMSRTLGQPRLHGLASYRDLDVTVLVPDRMYEYGRWIAAEPPAEADFRYVVGRARWRNVLNQWYLSHYPEALGRLMREIRPDVIDVWEEPWSLVCAQTVWLARRLCPGAKIVVETEQNIFKRLPPPFAQIQSYSLRHAHAMVARSGEAGAVLRRKGYGGPVAVVPNAVDCGLFRPMGREDRDARRRELGWGGPRDFVVGYVGRLVPEKGLSDALVALSMMPGGVRLVLVGEGAMRADLETQARELRVADRVTFAGAKGLTEMPGAMNALDALVLPSRTTGTWKEQFGRVLIEAGACAVPVVGSDSGAIPAVIADAGVIFPEGDPGALAACLRLLCDEPERRAALGEIGRDRAQRLFSWQCVAAQMHGLYSQVHRIPEAQAPPGPAAEAQVGSMSV